MCQDILVPTDDSQEADAAVARALDPARTGEATVHVVDTSLDLVAMGTRGRVAETDRLFGSTTASIVRRSTVPVLTRS
jgi:nucleotide-binding universal stress UspA family protein